MTRTLFNEYILPDYPGPKVEGACGLVEIKTVPLKYCEYDKKRKVLKLSSEFMGMPFEFFVKSHHTGKRVHFVAIGRDDKLFNHDRWDGTMQIYRPLGDVPGVDHMIISHQW